MSDNAEVKNEVKEEKKEVTIRKKAKKAIVKAKEKVKSFVSRCFRPSFDQTKAKLIGRKLSTEKKGSELIFHFVSYYDKGREIARKYSVSFAKVKAIVMRNAKHYDLLKADEEQKSLRREVTQALACDSSAIKENYTNSAFSFDFRQAMISAVEDSLNEKESAKLESAKYFNSTYQDLQKEKAKTSKKKVTTKKKVQPKKTEVKKEETTETKA